MTTWRHAVPLCGDVALCGPSVQRRGVVRSLSTRRQGANKPKNSIRNQNVTCLHAMTMHSRCRSAAWTCACCHSRSVFRIIVVFVEIRSGILKPQRGPRWSKFVLSRYLIGTGFDNVKFRDMPVPQIVKYYFHLFRFLWPYTTACRDMPVANIFISSLEQSGSSTFLPLGFCHRPEQRKIVG